MWGADGEIPRDNRTWELRREGGAKCTGISTRVVELPLTVTKQWLSKGPGWGELEAEMTAGLGLISWKSYHSPSSSKDSLITCFICTYFLKEFFFLL